MLESCKMDDLVKKYRTVICWSDEYGHFVAEVTELPGCMADGKTYLEAAANIHENMKLWIETALEEGRKLPDPCKMKKDLMFYLALPYEIKIEKCEESYAGYYPELPGCITQADSKEQLIEYLAEVKRLWIEAALEDGVSISLPKMLDDLD